MLVACGGSVQESASSDGIWISGTVGFPQEGVIKLEKLSNGNTTVPVAVIELDENYQYKHFIELDGPGYYRMNFYNKQIQTLILDEDDITLNVDGNSRTGFTEILGSRDHDLIVRVQKMRQELQSSQALRDINSRFAAASQRGDNEEMENLRAEYLVLEGKTTDAIANEIKANSGSLAALELLRGNVIDKDKYFEVYQLVSENLNNDHPEISVVKEFNQLVSNMAKLAIGQIAPEIALPNPDGNITKLSSLRGNYVLVDFWAKWCKPCRVENPNIVKMYNKYNDKGFEVFGVSLDRNKSDWLQAIEEDKLHWTQVSDLKYWNSDAAKLYNVTAIPFGILLDPDGKIVAKNLRGMALQKKLSEIFD